jgi:hypothetical protein
MSKIITPILLFIVSVGLFFSYIKPAYGTLNKLREQSIRLDKAIKESEVLLGRHADLMEKYNNISSVNKTRFKQFLPDALDSVGLIIEMDFLATKNNLDITTFEVPVIGGANLNKNRRTRQVKKDTEDNSPVHTATFVVECDGDYFDFKNFLLDVEKSLLPLDVVELEVNVADITEPGTEMGISYKIKLQTYWFK